MRLSTLIAAVALCTWGHGQERTLVEWDFDDGMQGWGKANHLSAVRAADGLLSGRVEDWDPYIVSPQFEIAAAPWQRIECRLKTDCGGRGEFFWTNTTDTRYGGFSPGKETGFDIVGDGQWHEYTIRPFWHAEMTIILLRLDLPRRPADVAQAPGFAVDWVRIVEPEVAGVSSAAGGWDLAAEGHGWDAVEGCRVSQAAEGLIVTNDEAGAGLVGSGPLHTPLEDRLWVSIEMAVDGGRYGSVRWASAPASGLSAHRFALRPDGRFHVYNIDMTSERNWQETIFALGLNTSDEAGATATVRRVSISDVPLGPPDVAITYVGMNDAISRVGGALTLLVQANNSGGEPASGVAVTEVALPEGVSVAAADGWQRLPVIEPFTPVEFIIPLKAMAPVDGEVAISVGAPGGAGTRATGHILVSEALDLPPADYVPEPVPAKTNYEIGAFYFPGWPASSRWEPVRQTAPERKPVLGWYDEANAECCDWQIKWAVENGISFFLVDWYWSAGSRHLEHWLHDAYMRARYRKYLKWCIMWANHNPPNTHSEDDFRAVARYWVDNYFGMDEYYRIDNRPVVMIWSTSRIRDDMGGSEGARRGLDICQQIAREAGYEGIYFAAMQGPDETGLKRIRDEGYSMSSIYHYMDHGGRAENPAYYPFELVADTSYDYWQSLHHTGILPFLPNLATGWDSRPWHGDKATVVYGRTVPLFRRICEDAKRFCEKTGIRRIALAPLNEWGEGSYAEPCKEFGFGMYNAVRDVFCEQPPDGWPLNVGPQDVGLGPYDLPVASPRSAWDFDDNTLQGWGSLMGVANLAAHEGALRFETTSADPAITASVAMLKAGEYDTVIIRMQLDRDATAQLFWETTTSSTSEAASIRFPVKGGQMAEYLLPVGENPRWRGVLKMFRLDPCSHAGESVVIEEIRLREIGDE